MRVFEAGRCPPARWSGRLTLDFTDARDGYATHAATVGGGRATNLASLRRFCAIAASVNSNWAPHGPRNRSRPSLRIRLRCANRISIFLRSRRDCSKPSVPTKDRATSRARCRLRAFSPIIIANHARRMQKDQLRAAHTIPPSYSGRRASSRCPCDHKESAVVYRLSNLAGRCRRESIGASLAFPRPLYSPAD
jgi:hypothetical protein